ncbi:MAG: hypothetical protein QNK86_14445 [Akkermansiaceae bacterium]
MKTYVINTHPLKQFPSIAKELKKNGTAPLLFHFWRAPQNLIHLL